MLKTSIEPVRHALNGPTMGTRWSALFYAAPGFDPGPVQAALQKSVDEIDAQMSTWKPDSALMQLNLAPTGTFHAVPKALADVIGIGLAIGRASGGAFDIGMGDAVCAWGFGAEAADTRRIQRALERSRCPAYEAIELDGSRILKRREIALDLNGIAKGYGVDQLAAVLSGSGVSAFLVGIDGEMRAAGLRPDGEAWTVAVEAPETDRRAPHSMLSLRDAAVATSGDYRHWVLVNGRRLSHTMDPLRGGPLRASPASVTVVASTCAEADAWATALMVAGPQTGASLAARHGLNALFLLRDPEGDLVSKAVGPLFS